MPLKLPLPIPVQPTITNQGSSRCPRLINI